MIPPLHGAFEALIPISDLDSVTDVAQLSEALDLFLGEWHLPGSQARLRHSGCGVVQSGSQAAKKLGSLLSEINPDGWEACSSGPDSSSPPQC